MELILVRALVRMQDFFVGDSGFPAPRAHAERELHHASAVVGTSAPRGDAALKAGAASSRAIAATRTQILGRSCARAQCPNVRRRLRWDNGPLAPQQAEPARGTARGCSED